MTHFQRFAQHKTRLRHRAFCRINQQQHTVNHVEYAFHFAAEISVTGRIDDVDLDCLSGFRVFDSNCRVLESMVMPCPAQIVESITRSATR